MLGVMIVPTGVGAEIGGHAGDATPASKLLAAVCDRLILHPNVVNASDINEAPPNSWYVEGSILDDFLWGHTGLVETKSFNRILLLVNAPARPEIVNAANAARVTIGAKIQLVELDYPLRMIAGFHEDGTAAGEVSGVEQLLDQIRELEFDALAISSAIECPKEVALQYLRNGGVNPWGAVEAIASKQIAYAVGVPVAHAPIESEGFKNFNEIVDPRMAPEIVSMAYLHCILKGLHRAPQPVSLKEAAVSVADVDVMISPWGVWGNPHEACREHGIPIIRVAENETIINKPVPMSAIVFDVENYLEAAGVIASMRAGVDIDSVRRPIAPIPLLKGAT